MVRLIVSRLAISALTLAIVSLLVFIGTSVLPGDVAQMVLGQSATLDSVAALRHDMGLDVPAWLRYVHWVYGFVGGHFGTSLASGTPVGDMIADRLGNTLLLAGITAAVAVPIAIGLGLTAAVLRDGWLDRLLSLGTVCVVAIPEFLIGTVLVLVFAVHLRWLPAISYVSAGSAVGQVVLSLALPVLTLSAIVVAQMARMTRAAVVNVLASPYIEMAMLKGVRRWDVVLKHALPNAMGPIANIVALNLAYLVSGVVVVETVFAYPGLAKLIVDGVATRDFPVVQACAMMFCMAYIVLMLLADIVAIVANPRLRQAP